MRILLLAGMTAAAAFSAHAGSIQMLHKDSDVAGSIEKVSCPACAPLKKKKVEAPEVTLTPGTQRVEIKEVNGVLKVYRTEAWLGGSPVTYVSNASTDLIDRKTAEAAMRSAKPDTADMPKDATVTIDTSTTSAVTADMSPPDLGAEARPEITAKTDATAKIEKDTAPTISKDLTSAATTAMSGNSRPAAKPEVAQHFNPQDLQLRLKVE